MIRTRKFKVPFEPALTAAYDGTCGPHPWELVWGQPYINCPELVRAIERELKTDAEPDFRTRLLVRDAVRAVRSYWGISKFDRWLTTSSAKKPIRSILKENLGKAGFRNIKERLVTPIGLTEIQQVFDLLGRGIHDRIEVYVAGSIPTLIKGLTARPTTDIDLVNEVPLEIRRQKAVLKQIDASFGLSLGHVQSHYLPANWQDRRHFLGDFGSLRVYLVDEYDIFVSKLSSKKEKHIDDLRVLARQLDKDKAKSRLLGDGRPFIDNPFLRPRIEKNWQFIYQEPLFSPDDGLSKSVTRMQNGKKKNHR